MRDKTASKTFRAKKKLDHFLEAALTRNLSAALHNGHVYANSIRNRRQTRSNSGRDRLHALIAIVLIIALLIFHFV